MNEQKLEEAYWEFDAMKNGDGPWRGHPQSERDAFKLIARGLLNEETKNMPRKSVVRFADLMEGTLKENDESKGTEGWLVDEGKDIKELKDKLVCLQRKMDQAFNDMRVDDVTRIAVDMANYSMMIADRIHCQLK